MVRRRSGGWVAVRPLPKPDLGRRSMTERKLLVVCIVFSILEVVLAWHTTGSQINDHLRTSVQQAATP